MIDALVFVAALAVVVAAAAAYVLGRHVLAALVWLKLAGWAARVVVRHWRLGATVAAAAFAFVLLQAPLQSAAFAVLPSLLAGAAAWLLLHGRGRGAAALGLLALTSVAAPRAAQALAPLAAVTTLAAVALAVLGLAASTLKGRTPREAFQATYTTPGLTGTVVGAVKEKGGVRVVMVAVADGETTRVTISGTLRDEFEEKAGGVVASTVNTTREVKKAWKRYLERGDPQLAVTLLLKTLRAGNGH
ncbi:MAG: hypothetical protein QW461_10635 [Candidatus Jordarchaeales archaeon]